MYTWEITHNKHVSVRVQIEFMSVLEDRQSRARGEDTTNTDHKHTLLFTS